MTPVEAKPEVVDVRRTRRSSEWPRAMVAGVSDCIIREIVAVRKRSYCVLEVQYAMAFLDIRPAGRGPAGTLAFSQL